MISQKIFDDAFFTTNSSRPMLPGVRQGSDNCYYEVCRTAFLTKFGEFLTYEEGQGYWVAKSRLIDCDDSDFKLWEISKCDRFSDLRETYPYSGWQLRKILKCDRSMNRYSVQEITNAIENAEVYDYPTPTRAHAIRFLDWYHANEGEYINGGKQQKEQWEKILGHG